VGSPWAEAVENRNKEQHKWVEKNMVSMYRIKHLFASRRVHYGETSGSVDNHIILRELKEDKRHAAFLASRIDYQEQIVLKGNVLAPQAGRFENPNGGFA
jgi:hypothetical protein